MSDEVTKDEWARVANVASAEGTGTHLQREVILNSGMVEASWPEMVLLSLFIDFVAKDTNGDLVFMDWIEEDEKPTAEVPEHVEQYLEAIVSFAQCNWYKA